MRALIPYDYGLDLLGELPEGVSVGVWDTYSEPPEGAAEATFWVPPWETLDSCSPCRPGTTTCCRRCRRT